MRMKISIILRFIKLLITRSLLITRNEIQEILLPNIETC